MRTKCWKLYVAAWTTVAMLCVVALGFCLVGCTTNLYQPIPEPEPDPMPEAHEQPVAPLSPVKDSTLTLR